MAEHLYIQREDLIRYLGLLEVRTNELESLLDDVAEDACREVDNLCGRRFWTATETRKYDVGDYEEVPLDDFVSVSSVKTDDTADGTFGTTWAATDYALLPRNALLDGEPYTSIRISNSGSYNFPTGSGMLQVIGEVGWPKIVGGVPSADPPDPVRRASMIIAGRLAERRKALLGLIGGADFAARIAGFDKDVDTLLQKYNKKWVIK